MPTLLTGHGRECAKGIVNFLNLELLFIDMENQLDDLKQRLS